MVAKRQKVRGWINLSSEEKKDYKSDIGDKIDPNQANNEYLLLF